MRKIIAVAAALTMLSVMVPAANAETVNAGYTVALGVSPGTAIIMCLGPPEQEICEENDIDPIGGYDARPSGSGFGQVTVTIDDDNFDSTFTSVCVYTDDHSICDEDVGDVSASGCGSMTLVAPNGISSANPVAGFVYNVHVDADTLETCLGSSGQAVAVYS